MNRAIGIMSGTSVDAIDAVLLDIDRTGLPVLRETATRPFPKQLKHRIVRLMTPGDNELEQAGRIHVELAEQYADIARELAHQVKNGTVSVIGCHGQTVRHRPDRPHPFTWQLGSGAAIACRTGIPTVTDFRSADLAVGGQGAPFAPFFHQEVFSSDSSYRAIVNLGGIANITLLPPPQAGPVSGWDTGPANCLMDLWTQRHRKVPYDASGAWAAQGNCWDSLLQRLLADPYFAKPPPKSTGREYFSWAWLEQALTEAGDGVAPQDVQATLAVLTAKSLVDQLPAAVDSIFLCGGGAANRHVQALIRDLSDRPVSDTTSLGFSPQWVEAATFGWMALRTLNRCPSTLPSVTGASRPIIAGAIHYP